ncbi:MAG: hypothetical protein NC084_02615 [Bacteroides sp.]|nr:hypothetical protein [Eubacterium sp.]MCM1417408.1 hypothetical protein [Roseburia sp.]MCM1461587.1 hypothetical protein [Bacteroides sp.]
MSALFQRKLFACVAALGIMSLSGCYFFPAEEELLDPPVIAPDEVAYSTFTARLKTIQNTVTVTGYVKSHTERECYFTDYTGKVKNVYVRAGDLVEEGDLVAEMNTGALEYELEIQRLKSEAAQLQYNSTGSRADLLQLEIEQNTLAMYQAEYDGARVYAPIAGQVSYVFKLNPGTEFDPYKVIARIADPEALFIEASYSDGRTFSVGDEVTVNIDGESYTGVVSYSPKEAREEGAENVNALYVEFKDEKPPFSYLGALADIVKVNATAENAVVIPKHLVKTDGEREYVQLFENGEKTERDVTTGIYNATEIEIVSGLGAGEQVIVK